MNIFQLSCLVMDLTVSIPFNINAVQCTTISNNNKTTLLNNFICFLRIMLEFLMVIPNVRLPSPLPFIIHNVPTM